MNRERLHHFRLRDTALLCVWRLRDTALLCVNLVERVVDVEGSARSVAVLRRMWRGLIGEDICAHQGLGDPVAGETNGGGNGAANDEEPVY